MPESISLSVNDMKKTLFEGMIYCFWDCYDHNNNFEFLHKDGTMYFADGQNKQILEKLLEVFPVIQSHMKNADLGDWTWCDLGMDGGSVIIRREIAQDYEDNSVAQYGEIIPNFELAKKLFDDLPLPIKNLFGMMEINSEFLNSIDCKDGWLYLGNDYERYLLGEPQEENLLIFGVNPSSATPKKLDPTMEKILKIISNNAEYKNFGYIMVNLAPQRTSDPKDLIYNSRQIENNFKAVDFIKKRFKIKNIWCAWGASIDKKNFLKDSLKRIKSIFDDNYKWIHYGELTKKGHPRHPLYTSLSATFSPFSINDYLK